MKIIEVINVVEQWMVVTSQNWLQAWKQIEDAITSVSWWGGETFLINPVGKHQNGVKPIKNNAMSHLLKEWWSLEHKWPTTSIIRPGDVDAVLQIEEWLVAFEWETWNVSSSHRSLNKLCMGLSDGSLVAGILIVPSRDLYKYLTDRTGNISELRPYISLWEKAGHCANGLLKIVVVEHDWLDETVPYIPKGTDGRALR